MIAITSRVLKGKTIIIDRVVWSGQIRSGGVLRRALRKRRRRKIVHDGCDHQIQGENGEAGFKAITKGTLRLSGGGLDWFARALSQGDEREQAFDHIRDGVIIRYRERWRN